MSFLRPEAVASLVRWREALIGAAAAAFGLWWLVDEAGARMILGGALFMGGVCLAVVGMRRARFRTKGNGPGIVRVKEGQLVYFGPETGGVVATSDITRIEFVALEEGPPHWVVSHGAGAPLHIAVDAVGSDALYDVFAGIPGLDTRALVRSQRDRPPGRHLIWAASDRRLH